MLLHRVWHLRMEPETSKCSAYVLTDLLGKLPRTGKGERENQWRVQNNRRELMDRQSIIVPGELEKQTRSSIKRAHLFPLHLQIVQFPLVLRLLHLEVIGKF